jgi:hypothetical protein
MSGKFKREDGWENKSFDRFEAEIYNGLKCAGRN